MSGEPNITFAIYEDPRTGKFEDISAIQAIIDRDDPLTASSARARKYFWTDKTTRLTPVGGGLERHFRLKNDDGTGSLHGAEESREHFVFKNILSEIEETVLRFGFRGKRYETRVRLRYPQVEMAIGNLRLDVGAVIEFDNSQIAHFFRGPLVALEVHFKHAIEGDKLQRLADLNVSVLEVLVEDRLTESASRNEAQAFKERVRSKLTREIRAELLDCESAEERYHRQQLEQAKQKEKTLLDKLDFAGNCIQNLELTKDRFLDQLDQATAEKRRLMDLLAKAEAKVDELETEPTLTRFWRKLIS